MPHLEFCHHVFKQLLGLRTAGLFEVIGNPDLDHDGLEVPANAWAKVSKGGARVGLGNRLPPLLSLMKSEPPETGTCRHWEHSQDSDPCCPRARPTAGEGGR